MRTGNFIGTYCMAAMVFMVTNLLFPLKGNACTGITLTSGDGAIVLARTIEWGGSNLASRYVIVPRGHEYRSFTSGGSQDGMKFTAEYGYVGLAVEKDEFIAEGLNEAGLSAGLFYFPGYGQYAAYSEADKNRLVSDFQLVPFILGSCRSIDEVISAVDRITIINIDSRASTVHWRFADSTGRQVVLEIVDGEPRFYENTLGVLTNSPGFEWQLTNLNNYVHLSPGSVAPADFGNIRLSAFGMGSGLFGLPGDITPPSRFVRAAFYQTSSPQLQSAEETVVQSLSILNNFDIPIGLEFNRDSVPVDIPSATQWTSATDVSNRKIYYKTMYNSTIRCIDLNDINFRKVKYQVQPLDSSKKQPIENIRIK